ncbi:HU family DNA-binding protein [Parabacteroides sp. PF5-6]|uniref:HU family DNA-binding protein n=1 Tax=Parabacteroides sp. PF5-6 TaxID=1742403 RepID=UPI00240760DF|nr:HU family DNA-binding protein [Parabacteroides sp. PF5-6]MDF9829511.1 putative histone-like DNA-binding protein [Parabacteroides sp. PF5-6]
MSAQYKIQEDPPKTPNQTAPSYHARFIPGNTVRIDQLCQEISDMSSFTPGDVRGIIQALTDRIVFHLEYGDDLDIEGLGHFTASLHCDQPQNGIRFSAAHVKFKTVKFRCCKLLKERLQSMRFKPVPKEERYSGIAVEKRKENILNHLRNKSVIQSSTCMAINSCSRYMAIQDLKALIAEGKIVQIGNKKSAMYRQETTP